MTTREWFREMRRANPPSLELREFLRTFGRTDSDALANERTVLFHVALVEMGVKEPDHPNALTLHRMELGFRMMSGSLAFGDTLALEPRVKLVRPEPVYDVWPFNINQLMPIPMPRAGTTMAWRDGSWRTLYNEGASGDPTSST